MTAAFLRHRHHDHGGSTYGATVFILLLLILSVVSVASRCLNLIGNNGLEERKNGRGGLRALLIDKYLTSQTMRLGSSPPTCRFKCGRCNPCTPVHVAIHPGMTIPLEYYPEAWRCKCGNKLFMP